MADDFTRLVSKANPAASQYQRANSGYPPSAPPYDSHNSPQLLDPFFDDEDEGEGPDSAFGALPSSHAKESALHLPSQAAPLAGTSKLSLPTNGAPQGWTFDQDDPPPQALSPPPRNIKKAPRRTWKLPWQKEQVLTGERVIALNHPDANADFLSNYVSTAKYNTATFVPKFFFGQCPGSWRTSRLPAVLTHSSAFRAILEIRQSILPFYRMYSTNSWCLAHQQVDHHRTACHRPLGFRFQRGPRRSRASPILSTLKSFLTFPA
jgi:hypothetical protein